MSRILCIRGVKLLGTTVHPYSMAKVRQALSRLPWQDRANVLLFTRKPLKQKIEWLSQRAKYTVISE